jgi:hypothetical protein
MEIRQNVPPSGRRLQELDRALSRHPAIGSEPKERYRFGGRVHPSRLDFSSLTMQARIYAKALVRADRPRTFLIFGRPRSGSTVLLELLNKVPAIRCDTELLHDITLFPSLFVRALARRAGSEVYGLKLLSYQMTEVQRIHRPLAFLGGLVGEGFAMIHLRRDTWAQTLSLMKARESSVFALERARHIPETLVIPEERFVACLAWNARMLAFEDEVMSHLPHLRVQYETDLLEAASHQPSIDAICAHLGAPSGPVSAGRKRISAEPGRMRVANLDALRAAAAEAGLGHLLPGAGPAGGDAQAAGGAGARDA